ncbi:MAG: acyltransferase family protein [Actinomycetaceae bacterium]|nr:acyltransferase family protein [Actinomycetaceae bacterium]
MAIVIFSNYILPDINAVKKVLGFEKQLTTELAGNNVFSMFVVCILIGYFVVHHNVMGKISTPVLIGLTIVSFVAFCAFQLWFFSADYDYVIRYNSCFPLITATFLFELLHRAQPGKQISRIAEKLSKMALGIYFVHICIMEGLMALINHYHWDITHLSRLAFLELVSFFGSILIILICEKSELMKKYLFIIK